MSTLCYIKIYPYGAGWVEELPAYDYLILCRIYLPAPNRAETRTTGTYTKEKRRDDVAVYPTGLSQEFSC